MKKNKITEKMNEKETIKTLYEYVSVLKEIISVLNEISKEKEDEKSLIDKALCENPHQTIKLLNEYIKAQEEQRFKLLNSIKALGGEGNGKSVRKKRIN